MRGMNATRLNALRRYGSDMSNAAKLQLGFSPLSKTIMLAKMRDIEGGRLRVGSDPGRDVTNEAAQLVWQLVIAEGGEIAWDMDDGSRMVLKAEKIEAPAAVQNGGCHAE